MRIVFFGTPEFAAANLQYLIENGNEIDAVVTPADSKTGRGKQLKPCAVKQVALTNNLPVLQPEKLRADGFVPSEKKVNAAIRMKTSDKWEKLIWGKLCDFGADPLRPLEIVFYIFIFMAFINFYIFTKSSDDKYGYYFYATKFKGKENKHSDIHYMKIYLPIEGVKSYVNHPCLILKFFGYAILFSLFSASRIGFRDVNIANWIKIISPLEIDIRSSGSAKFFSGIQSLISVLMLTLSLLSYFGRPFNVG